MSRTFQLAAQQQQVLALIASGFNATTAARHAGVHRNTITNWLKTEPFREALVEARLEKQILYWDEAETLVAEVIHDLRNLSHDLAVSPSIRLKAMLALLQHANRVLPCDAPLVLPSPMHNDAQPAEGHSHQPPATNHQPLAMHNDAQLPERSEDRPPVTSHRPPATAANGRPKVGRNELCPCGSGVKFKRCCLDKMRQPAQVPLNGGA